MPRRRATRPVTGGEEEEPRGVGPVASSAWAWQLPGRLRLGGCDAVVQAVKDIKMKLEEQLVLNLCNPALRGNALAELSKKREMFPDLAPLMWHSFGTMVVLLQEIVSVYPALSPPTLSASDSNRACNVLALLQSVASHPETRTLFLKAEMAEYLYPLLNTTSDARSFEYLRLTTLGVLGALVKVDDSEAVNSLINSEVIPLCLRIMETGSELSKTVATFIIQKIIIDEAGLEYICGTPERLYGIASVLASMVAEQPSARLMKHIVRCYLRLTDNSRARTALQTHLPEALRDRTFDNIFEDDMVATHCFQQLMDNLAVPVDGAPPPPPVPCPEVAGVTHPGPTPAAGGAPHPGAGPVAGGSPGGSSEAGSSRVHPGLGPVAGGSPRGSSQAGPSPAAGGDPHPGQGPVASGSPGGSSQAGPRRKRR